MTVSSSFLPSPLRSEGTWSMIWAAVRVASTARRPSPPPGEQNDQRNGGLGPGGARAEERGGGRGRGG
eukprot:2437243-Pyramimonas_sp.AAC.1